MDFYKVFDKKTGLYVGSGWKEKKRSKGKIFKDRRTLLNFIQSKSPDFIFVKNRGRFEIEEYRILENNKIEINRILIEDYMQEYLKNKKNNTAGWQRCDFCKEIVDHTISYKGKRICLKCRDKNRT